MENAHIFAKKLGKRSLVELHGKKKDVVALIIATIHSFADENHMSFGEALKALERIEKHGVFIKVEA